MKTETYSHIFDNRVSQTVKDFKDIFESTKAKFADGAAKSPTWAIECFGSSVVRAEEAYAAVARVGFYLNRVGKDYETKKEAVQACLDYFRDILVRAATDSPSSCAVTNGVDFAKRLGIADAVRALELLVDHEFINH